jgi:hypothetical protein
VRYLNSQPVGWLAKGMLFAETADACLILCWEAVTEQSSELCKSPVVSADLTPQCDCDRNRERRIL